jgi:DNA-binding CsgD family transcriptional regulator
MKKIKSKYKPIFLIAAIVISSIAISIRSKDGEVKFILGDYPVIIFLMVVLSSFLYIIYIQLENRNTTKLKNQIRSDSIDKGNENKVLLNKLTSRQREVYDLIIEGKSNKEIKNILFIEQSTLKTHINQIYKKLNIKSRQELKSNVE